MAERYFARIKPYRRVATRYDKKAANFLGLVWVASIAILLALLATPTELQSVRPS